MLLIQQFHKKISDTAYDCHSLYVAFWHKAKWKKNDFFLRVFYVELNKSAEKWWQTVNALVSKICESAHKETASVIRFHKTHKQGKLRKCDDLLFS